MWAPVLRATQLLFALEQLGPSVGGHTPPSQPSNTQRVGSARQAHLPLKILEGLVTKCVWFELPPMEVDGMLA